MRSKGYIKLIVFMCIFFLCACGSKEADADKENGVKLEELLVPKTEEVTTENVITEETAEAEETAEEITEEEKTEPRNMALLEINTISDDAEAIRFATEPVTGFVAASIKTWNPDYNVVPEPYYEDCTVKLTDTDGKVTIEGAEAEVKVRGNWTTCYPKKPFRIKFKEKQSMLGLNGGAEKKNWVLLAEYKDASLLRNKTAFYMGWALLEEDGRYCADSEFVEVTINGEYWGVYLLTERQEADRKRINVTDPEKDYTGTDIGYILELDGYYVYEELDDRINLKYADNAPLIPFDGKGGSGERVTPLRKAGESYRKDIGISIKSDTYSDEQREFIRNYLDKVYYIMYAAAYLKRSYRFNDDYTEVVRATELELKDAVERVVDLNSLIDMYILSEMTCDQDLYWSSFYMDVDFGEYGDRRLRFEAPWDYDSAMGNTCDPEGLYAANMIYDENNRFYAVNPWLNVLMNADWFREMVKDRWMRIYDSGLFDKTCAMIREDSEKYSEEFNRNYEKWDNILDDRIIDELTDRAKECTTQQEAAEYLEEWISNRAEYLNGYWGKDGSDR